MKALYWSPSTPDVSWTTITAMSPPIIWKRRYACWQRWKRYSVDTDRVYATGRHGLHDLYVPGGQVPGLFSAELFVDGKWDISQ